jgi:hypothetical protein
MERLNSLNIKLKYSSDLDCNECAKKTGNLKLKEKFLELNMDKETEDFINSCFDSKFQLFKASYFRSWLTYFYTITDANAILGTGKMFMFSKEHLQTLLDGELFENMLDIGAGDGYVTQQFRSLVKGDIVCTESSQKMIKSLRSQGYKLQNEIEGEFELISCLNVLDRCDRPISIFKKILDIKKKKVIISIVLPFKGFYYNGNKQYPQEENLIGYYKNWEENVNILSKYLMELGFIIDKIARVPYLSEGNYYRQIYTLDTVVFVLS